jgi:uncharacterized protein
MYMNRIDQILKTEEFVKANLKGYDSGHDWFHIVRVRKVAAYINGIEKLADPFIVDITALLHDTADSKFISGKIENGYAMIGDFMVENGMAEFKDRVINVIKNVSFSSKNKAENPDDPLLFVIQDADRLDAIGAIGVARAFNYGGFRNNKIYDPAIINTEGNDGTSSTVSHFYEKLLLLKYRMNTLTAKRLADERHEFLEIFLRQFYKEWNFGNGTGASDPV